MGRKKKTPPPSFSTMGDWHTHFTPFFDDQLNSLAYVNLSAHAKEAYTIIRQEYKGNYTGDFVICPYGTFKKKGMRPNTVSRAILQLECFGFIQIDRGGLEHKPSVYHLISDWKKIRTEEDLEEVKRVFQEELNKKKKSKEIYGEIRRMNETNPYGIYTSSNESVSKEDKKSGGIDIEFDSILPDLFGVTPTKAIPNQVPKAFPENESIQIPKTIAESKTCQVPKTIFGENYEEYQPKH